MRCCGLCDTIGFAIVLALVWSLAGLLVWCIRAV
jgi:hypothetical protein